MSFIRKAHALASAETLELALEQALAKAQAQAQQSPAASWLALSLGFIALALLGSPN